MVQDLSFSHNWNGKLNCDCFTTIRLENQEKYFVGARKRVVLKDQPRGMATVIAVKAFKIHDLNDFTARIDTGLSATECRDMIYTMYKNKRIDWKWQWLVLVLLQYDKDRQMPKLDF